VAAPVVVVAGVVVVVTGAVVGVVDPDCDATSIAEMVVCDGFFGVEPAGRKPTVTNELAVSRTLAGSVVSVGVFVAKLRQKAITTEPVLPASGLPAGQASPLR
jgi:hypothetical protein